MRPAYIAPATTMAVIGNWDFLIKCAMTTKWAKRAFASSLPEATLIPDRETNLCGLIRLGLRRGRQWLQHHDAWSISIWYWRQFRRPTGFLPYPPQNRHARHDRCASITALYVKRWQPDQKSLTIVRPRSLKWTQNRYQTPSSSPKRQNSQIQGK